MVKTRLLGFFSISIFALISLSGCGSDIDTFSDIPVDNPQFSSIQSTPVANYPARVQAFISNVSRFGINLNDEQIRQIYTQRYVRPSGKFASRPALNLTSEQNLDIHFKKHYKEFKGISNKEQYLQKALQFLTRESPSANYYFDTTSFAKGYQSNIVKYDAQTHELSAVRNDGDITTFYTSDMPSPKRFVVVPENPPQEEVNR